jgi:hypothetical protein
MLDKIHDDSLPQDPSDHNSYTLGRVGLHNIVVACLPAGQIGNNNAAIIATEHAFHFYYNQVLPHGRHSWWHTESKA